MAFPIELVTMFGSTVMGWGLSLFSKITDAKIKREEMLIGRAKAQDEIYSAAREYSNRGYQLTRRFIAIAAVLSIIVWPKIVAVFWPEIPVSISWTELKDGFLFFTDSKEILQWRDIKGLVITPLDTHLMMAIVGLFFGTQITKT
jgi:hypothetical protein